ncbi:increased DNA methylation 1-like [Bidens hawaiensis]|uniref:increased DNA methylation 1-like n=1 Tax=Bidens hawaiensis TaxID=980011 RepID=UPI00404A73C1
MKCVGPISNEVSGGTVSATKEEATNRCIRINANQTEHDLVACSLCRSYEFSILSVDGFNDKTVIVCDQCEIEFHIGCLRAHRKRNLKELPPGGWFCSSKCWQLNRDVKVLVVLGSQKVPDSLMGNYATNCDAEWRIVRGKHTTEENNLLLNEAAKIFDVGFNPIIDTRTKKDMIKAMTYGTEIAGSDFAGVHCFILTIGPKVVTAGLFRVLGHDVAELPIVATGQQYQGQGHFKVFFRCFERLLSQLNVKKLVVPAAEEVIAMWCNKFGLRKVTPIEQNEYMQKHTSMVAFTGTSLLEKEVPEGQRLL